MGKGSFIKGGFPFKGSREMCKQELVCVLTLTMLVFHVVSVCMKQCFMRVETVFHVYWNSVSSVLKRGESNGFINERVSREAWGYKSRRGLSRLTRRH